MSTKQQTETETEPPPIADLVKLAMQTLLTAIIEETTSGFAALQADRIAHLASAYQSLCTAEDARPSTTA